MFFSMRKTINSILFLSIFLLFFQCSKEEIPLRLGTPMKMMGIDTSGDGNKDSFGYYLLSKNNRRIVYQEMDKNADGQSDEFIWVGSSSSRKKGALLNEPVKVYEESDENNNGKIDTIRWYLPNEIISMELVDSDEDGYFETTNYYNFKKIIARREIDSNQDGYANIYIWNNRAEIDSDGDKIPDRIVLGKSALELEDKAVNDRDTKKMNPKESWFLNPRLIPLEERSIIGSGTFVD